MVQGLVAATGFTLPTAEVAYPGYSLADHLQRAEAAQSIATRRWRVVVLQQGLPAVAVLQDAAAAAIASYARR